MNAQFLYTYQTHAAGKEKKQERERIRIRLRGGLSMNASKTFKEYSFFSVSEK